MLQLQTIYRNLERFAEKVTAEQRNLSELKAVLEEVFKEDSEFVKAWRAFPESLESTIAPRLIESPGLQQNALMSSRFARLMARKFIPTACSISVCSISVRFVFTLAPMSRRSSPPTPNFTMQTNFSKIISNTPSRRKPTT